MGMMTNEEKIKILCKVEDRLFNDLNTLMEKKEINANEWKAVFDALDGIKDAITSSAMKIEYPEEDLGESERGYRSYRRNYSMGYGPMDESFAGPYRMRDDMGRYAMGANSYNNGPSYNNGRSSYHGDTNNAATNIRNLMNSATSESERAMYQRFLEEAERYGR